ncbi:dTDP-glucose 4,6-dehydratase [Bacillus cereus]|uniref:dTDP-glucose 4,6-dehydratase n=1 Tax=Bacillus pseudomycoides TaxID=64104 RepID=UPI002FFE48EB
MNILVTGGAGFIGSNFVRYIIRKYHNYNIVNYDALTYSGNLNNLRDIEGKRNYTFIKGEIQNRDLVEQVICKYKIDAVINFAAESHVDRSINNPTLFCGTNVLGVSVLLELIRKYNDIKFVQISTDEVYGSLGNEGIFSEDTPLSPSSPYASSKASADLIALSYYKTYGSYINITRCSNNYGPYQHPEKLIPLMITNALEEKGLPLYGNGENIRDWLHVYDHCAAIDLVLHKGKSGEIYNIGGNNEKKNIEVIKKILRNLRKSESLIHFVQDRLGHDWRYAIDANKITTELGWKPTYTFEEGLEETIQWYMDREEWWKPLKI